MLLAFVSGLVSRPLFFLFPAASVLPIMWVLGGLLSALIVGRSGWVLLAPVALFLGFLLDPPPVSMSEQLAVIMAVAAGALAIAGMRTRLAPDIRPGMTAREIAGVSCLGLLATVVTTCVWALGFALVKTEFPPPGVFTGALLRLGLSVLIWLPLFVAWVSDPPRRPGWRRALHFSTVLAATAANCAIVYLTGLHDALAWTALPLLVWAALAFHARGVTAAVAIVSFVALYATTHSLGPFYPHDLRHVGMMEVFIAVLSVTMLLLARLADKRQTEEAWLDARRELTATRARLEIFVRDAPAAIAMFDRDMRYIAYSHRYLTDYGLPPDQDLAGRYHYDVFPEIPEAWRDLHRRVLEGEEFSAERDALVRPSGRTDYVRWKLKPWHAETGKACGVILFSEVITEAVEARHAAEEATARYRAVFGQAQIGIARSTLERRFFEINQPACVIAGRSREEMLSLTAQDITDPADWKVMEQAMEEMLAGRRSSIEREEKILTGDGRTRWVMINVSMVRNPSGKPLEFVSVVQDISGRKNAEIALAESEARWRLAQQIAGVGTWAFQKGEAASYFSPMSQKHFGLPMCDGGFYSIQEQRSLLGGVFDVFDFEIQRALREKSSFDFRTAIPVTVEKTRWIRVMGGYGPHDSEGHILGLTMDVSEQVEGETRLRAAREQVLRVSRLSAMGSMASTLAHELNQPLAAISNFCAAGRHMLLDSDRPSDEKLVDLLDRAVGQARRAGEIIRKMRQFTVTGELSLNPENLNGILQSACELVRERKDSAGVRIICDADPGLPDVMADRLQLEQVVINLVANAAQATAGCDVRKVQVRAACDGGTVAVSVADSGVGIPADIRDNLFEPFRTTKEKGLGLGLPICRTIIEAHGGRLWEQPNIPRGAILSFTLTIAQMT